MDKAETQKYGSPPPPPDLEEVVRKCTVILGEYFDAVQILCSVQLPGSEGTQMVALGSGNWFARAGMARRLLIRDTAQEFSEFITP